MNTFGELVRQRRQDLAMRQDDLARLAKVSRATIINYEYDRYTPNLFDFIRICRALNLEAGRVIDVFYGEDVVTLNVKEEV